MENHLDMTAFNTVAQFKCPQSLPNYPEIDVFKILCTARHGGGGL